MVVRSRWSGNRAPGIADADLGAGGGAGRGSDGGQPVDVTVAHAVAPERAAQLWATVERAVVARDRLETLIGPVVGSHAGSGAVGVVVAPVG